MRVGAVIQARMGSSRLPGKVLMDVEGLPMLERLVRRLKKAASLDVVLIATSVRDGDDPIASFCVSRNIPCHRGSENDVLKRYCDAAEGAALDVVVRITADCPLIDPEIVDELVQIFKTRSQEFRMVTNRKPITFPDGLDADVLSTSTLLEIDRSEATAYQREHVIPYIWENGLPFFNLECQPNQFYSQRWTVDYPEDIALVRAVIRAFPDPDHCPGWKDIANYLSSHPEILKINAMYLPKHEL